jgi:hypothetical protein
VNAWFSLICEYGTHGGAFSDMERGLSRSLNLTRELCHVKSGFPLLAVNNDARATRFYGVVLYWLLILSGGWSGLLNLHVDANLVLG